MKLMRCCEIVFGLLLSYCICELLENRFLQKVVATAKSDFHISLKNESLVLEILLDTCVNKKWDNNVLLIIENTVDHCITFKCSFSRKNPIHLFQSNVNFDSRRRFREIYLMLNKTEIAKYHKPTSCAIIITSNNTEFTKLMLKMKNSIWWRHDAYFIIVNIYNTNSCQLAHTFLKQAWSFNVLSAVYICKNLNDQEEVYTFNPYAAIAPKFWTRVDGNALDSSWSLFQLSVEPTLTSPKLGKFLCNDLFFDKGKNLNGTNLNVGLHRVPRTQRYNSTKSGYERFTSFELEIMANALQDINASVTVKFTDHFGYANNYGEPQGALKDLISGTLSIHFNIRFLRHYWKFQVHSFYEDSIAITTMKMRISLIEQLGKHSSKFLIYLFIMSLSLTMILKYILKQSISLAALNYMRICLSNSSLAVPQNPLRRILLLMFILIAFVSNSSMLGYFTSMESASNILPVIDTYDDLIKSGLAIRGKGGIYDLVWQPDFLKRYETVNDIGKCFDRLLKGDNSIACVESRYRTGFFVRESELFHVSKYSLIDRGVSFLLAEDFPLFSTIQSLLLRMNEGGFVNLLYAREAFYRFVRFSESYSVEGVKLENIYYVFTILIGSWILGILVVCIEIVTFKFKFFELRPHMRCRDLNILNFQNGCRIVKKVIMKRSDRLLKALQLKSLKK